MSKFNVVVLIAVVVVVSAVDPADMDWDGREWEWERVDRIGGKGDEWVVERLRWRLERVERELERCGRKERSAAETANDYLNAVIGVGVVCGGLLSSIIYLLRRFCLQSPQQPPRAEASPPPPVEAPRTATTANPFMEPPPAAVDALPAPPSRLALPEPLPPSVGAIFGLGRARGHPEPPPMAVGALPPPTQHLPLIYMGEEGGRPAPRPDLDLL